MSFLNRTTKKPVASNAPDFRGDSGGVIENDAISSIPIRVDVYKGDEVYHLLAQLPGVEKDTLTVGLTKAGDKINIRGVKRPPLKAEIQPLVREGFWGEFNRTVSLPHAVASANPEAVMKNGVLHITVPIQQAKNVETNDFKKRF